MSPIISPRLSEETLFSFLTQFRPLESKFSADFSISKEPFFLDPLSANAQNGQTHSLLTNCLSVLDHFVESALIELNFIFMESELQESPNYDKFQNTL